MHHHEAYSSSLDIRPKQEPLTISFGSPGFIQLQEDVFNATNAVVPLRPHSPEPQSHPALESPSSRESGSEPLEDEKESMSEPHRSGSPSSVSGKSDKEKVEKRKRSRVTPEQLVHLERFFLLDRSPTAARRREISDLLGMQERQTQIWFQNR